MKKTILYFSCLALGSILLTSCGGGDNSTPAGGSSSDGEITLKFWHGFTGADGDSMDIIVNNFNTEYAGRIKIQMEEYTWDTLFTKLYTTSTNPKFMPHVIATGANRLAGVKKRKLLLTMDDVMDKFHLGSSDFLPAAYNAGMIDGHRYSFPLDTHPTAIYYNKDLIEESELPSTWDEFIQVCRDKTQNGVYGWAIPNQYSITKDIFYSMLLQKGKDIFNSQTVISLNSSEAVQVLSTLEEWKYVDAVSPVSVGNGGDYNLFRAGKSVFYFDGPWTLNSMLSDDGLNFEFGTFEMPGSTGVGSTSFAGSHQLCMINKTVTTDALKEASYTFMNYLTEHSLEWAKAGQVPARLSVHELQEFKELTYLAPFVEEAKTAQLGRVDYTYFYEAYNYMGQAVANALSTQTADAEAKLTEMNTRYKRFLEEEE